MSHSFSLVSHNKLLLNKTCWMTIFYFVCLFACLFICRRWRCAHLPVIIFGAARRRRILASCDKQMDTRQTNVLNKTASCTIDLSRVFFSCSNPLVSSCAVDGLAGVPVSVLEREMYERKMLVLLFPFVCAQLLLAARALSLSKLSFSLCFCD